MKYLTVAELIKKLGQCDPNALVCVRNHGDRRGVLSGDVSYVKATKEVNLEGGG